MSIMDSVMEEIEGKTKGQRRALQKEALRSLGERGVDDSALAGYLRTDLRMIRRWRAGTVLARPASLAQLVYLSRRQRLPKMEARTQLRQGRASKADRLKKMSQMERHGLWPPSKRAATLAALRDASKLSAVDFAERLGIGRSAYYKYLDPTYPGVMREDVVDKVIALQKQVASGPTALKEFNGYLTELFGARYAESGLPLNHPLREPAIQELRRRTALSEYTLHKNLPPVRTGSVPRRSFVNAIRTAAQQGLLLPELGSPNVGDWDRWQPHKTGQPDTKTGKAASTS